MTTTRHELVARMTLPTFWRPVRAVHANGFNDVVPWPAGPYLRPGGGGITITQGERNGLGEMWVDWDRDTAEFPLLGSEAYYILDTGVLQIGRSYRMTARAYNRGTTPAQVRMNLGAYGSATPDSSSPSTAGWTTLPPGVSVPFEVYNTLADITDPSSNSLRFQVRTETPVDAHVAFTDVVVEEVERTTQLDLRPDTATIVLDESWSPYVRATLTCPIPARDALAKIDPRVVPRVQLVATKWDGEHLTLTDLSGMYAGKTLSHLTTAFVGDTLADLTALFARPYNSDGAVPARNQTRAFDLHVRRRTLDYVAGTMTLELAGDELLLQDYGRWESTTSALTPPSTSDLADLVQWGLNRIGAALDTGLSVSATIDPAAVVWNLGESLWSFLDAFVRPAGLRLWCDERRRWRLTAPLTGASGTLPLTSLGALEDELTRDGDFADVVTIKYEWIDASGVVRTGQGNHFGTPFPPAPKLLVQTHNVSMFTAPPGGPLALWRRSTTRGRNVRARAVSDYNAAPGMAVTFNTPYVSITGAMVQAVSWDFPSDEMSITTRDAIA